MTAQSPLEDRVRRIDQDFLTPIVRRAVGKETAEIESWEWKGIFGSGGGQGNSAVYQFSGVISYQGERQSWSLILKVIREQAAEFPSSSHYWKREIEAYRSGWLDKLPGGSLDAPACFGAEEYPGEACWLWLEDLSDIEQEAWTLEHYGRVARHLGQFNGAYLVNEPLPTYPWLSRDWIRQDTTVAGKKLPNLELPQTTPLQHRILSEKRCEKLIRLYSERDLFFKALDQLPRTVLHLDAFRGNIFSRRAPNGDNRTLLIDWAFSGIEAVGAELVSLFWITLAFVEVGMGNAEEFDRTIFEGYLDGLRDAGWQGDPKLPRLGFTAAIGLRHFETMTGMQEFLADEKVAREIIESVSGIPLDTFIERAIGLSEYIDHLTDEARHQI